MGGDAAARVRRPGRAAEILASAAGRDGRAGDAALLSAVSMCFALGAATIEQLKHLAAAEAGPLAGLGALPGLWELRPALAAIAEAADPLKIQSMFASAMLAAGPVTSGVYYADDHFVPYIYRGETGRQGLEQQAGPGRTGPRRHPRDRARRAGRVLRDPASRPGRPGLPKALAELKKAAGPGAKIMLGFDRGGACPAGVPALP